MTGLLNQMFYEILFVFGVCWTLEESTSPTLTAYTHPLYASPGYRLFGKSSFSVE